MTDLSLESKQQDRSLVLSETVISKRDAVMRVTQLELSDEGNALLQSKSKSIGNGREKSVKSEEAAVSY